MISKRTEQTEASSNIQNKKLIDSSPNSKEANIIKESTNSKQSNKQKCYNNLVNNFKEAIKKQEANINTNTTIINSIESSLIYYFQLFLL